jgi:hypothetical protein
MIADLQEAEKVVFRLVQGECFEKEIKILQGVGKLLNNRKQTREKKTLITGKSCLFRLDPFIEYSTPVDSTQEESYNYTGYTVFPPPDCTPRACGMTSNEIRSNGIWIMT